MLRLPTHPTWIRRMRILRRRWSRRHAGSRFLVDMCAGAVLMMVAHTYLLQVSVVRGHSMEPSLWDGDRLVVDRVTCSLGEMARGDVVVLRYPRNPMVDFVKRIVGVPGDTVSLRRGQLWVNGEMVAADDWTCINDAETTEDYAVPAGHYFVLGDNRPVSCDSREFGLVRAELLKGRVRARFWPLDRLGVF